MNWFQKAFEFLKTKKVELENQKILPGSNLICFTSDGKFGSLIRLEFNKS